MTSPSRKNTTTSAAAASEPTLTEDSSAVETPAEVEKPTTGDEAVEPAVESGNQVTTAADAPAATTNTDLVTVELAHPLDKAEDLRHLGLEPKEGGYRVHDEIQVTRANARSLINAGYAKGIDPENTRAVDAVLKPGA